MNFIFASFSVISVFIGFTFSLIVSRLSLQISGNWERGGGEILSTSSVH